MANPTFRQARNIAKHLRIARATTGDESFKHYMIIDKLIKKYDLTIPGMEEVDFSKAVLDSVDTTREGRWSRLMERLGRRKIFYKHNELRGWRFYLKAILNFDLRSLRAHLQNSFAR